MVTAVFFEPDSGLCCLPDEPPADDGSERQLVVLAVLRAVSPPVSVFWQHTHTRYCFMANGQPMLASTSGQELQDTAGVKFTADMPLLTATRALSLGRRC